MTTWQDLDRELESWRRLGRTVSLWWRDDDAVEPTPALDRLLALSENHHIPVAIAVVPQGATDSLRRRLEDQPTCTVLQHGFGHANHAPQNEKKAEFGAHREHDDMLAELTEGHDRMRGFERTLPVLVPPWNRIDSGLFPRLGEIGIAALSTFGPRKTAKPVPGLRQVNTHIDPIAWHDGRHFAGETAVLGQLTGHLAARRAESADDAEPTGILTHHLASDEAGWAFLETLFDRTNRRPDTKWLTAEETFRQ